MSSEAPPPPTSEDTVPSACQNHRSLSTLALQTGKPRPTDAHGVSHGQGHPRVSSSEAPSEPGAGNQWMEGQPARPLGGGGAPTCPHPSATAGKWCWERRGCPAGAELENRWPIHPSTLGTSNKRENMCLAAGPFPQVPRQVTGKSDDKKASTRLSQDADHSPAWPCSPPLLPAVQASLPCVSPRASPGTAGGGQARGLLPPPSDGL